MFSSQVGDFQFRTDSIGAGDQDRILVVTGKQAGGEINLEKSGKATIGLDHTWRIRAMHELRQSRHGFLVGFQVDTGFFVGRRFHKLRLIQLTQFDRGYPGCSW